MEEDVYEAELASADDGKSILNELMGATIAVSIAFLMVAIVFGDAIDSELTNNQEESGVRVPVCSWPLACRRCRRQTPTLCGGQCANNAWDTGTRGRPPVYNPHTQRTDLDACYHTTPAAGKETSASKERGVRLPGAHT